ncbi:hypothetical protein HFN69_21995 [Rhizobium laguerreae]|uniref:hypothetical protein n=1 Tax=Rhizobium laguerreae TaxID=1076926 RepID=UPI001C910EB3|nr:hypothetical protein [Rhizobium laguerreae]MBY3544794.1 hypothetical protein [Rhizobium laguerreae]MBY3549251.1 hypothetical protein [Rhizobium laguerreae]
MSEPQDRIFVSIAVSKPDGELEALPGAIKASERMAAWAKAHGYISLLINENLFAEVTTDLLRTEIAEAIEEVTDRTALRRLVVFLPVTALHSASTIRTGCSAIGTSDRPKR